MWLSEGDGRGGMMEEVIPFLKGAKKNELNPSSCRHRKVTRWNLMMVVLDPPGSQRYASGTPVL
jgi:hypothetical protein